MELTTPQLQVLKTDILAQTGACRLRDARGNDGQMAAWYNVDSTFIVYKHKRVHAADRRSHELHRQRRADC